MNLFIKTSLMVVLFIVLGFSREMIIYRSGGITRMSVNDVDSIKFSPQVSDTFANLSNWEFDKDNSATLDSGALRLTTDNLPDPIIYGYSKVHYFNTDFSASCDASMGSIGPFQEVSFGVTYYNSKDSALGQILLSIRREAGVKKYEISDDVFLKAVTSTGRKQVSYNWDFNTFYNLKIVRIADTCSFYINNTFLEKSLINDVKYSYLRITVKAYESTAKLDNVQFE